MSLLLLLLCLLFSVVAWQAPRSLGSQVHQNFLQCLLLHSPNSTSFTRDVFTPANSSYSPVLQSSIYNLRFAAPGTPKPLFIITPSQESDIQAAVICSKASGLQVRVRSGGHDHEGLSYKSDVPFVVIDMTNLRSVSVDVEKKTAWVQSGATLGELYYGIANKSQTLGFPAGVCPTVCVGGHFGGGGYGFLIRKYGLAADNVIDARIIVTTGAILDRRSMGEDLFWAIRGGGGASFGVIISYKIELVLVPPTVTMFVLSRNSSQNATGLVHRWQYVAPNLSKDLYILVSIRSANASQNGNNTRTVQASFASLFLGKTQELLYTMNKSFPELGLVREDCVETRWIDSIMFFAGFPVGGAPELLLNRIARVKEFYKIKSDYVTTPISGVSLERLWESLHEETAQQVRILFVPYGGIMSEISESKIPFPHRAGNIYKIGYIIRWTEEEEKSGEYKRHIDWIRRLYDYMAPYVSSEPRRAYLNYRDLDLGTNEKGYNVTSYKQASIWGSKYFNKNFDRLVKVKTKVDPTNFFRNEQTIPSVLGMAGH